MSTTLSTSLPRHGSVKAGDGLFVVGLKRGSRGRSELWLIFHFLLKKLIN